MVLLSPLSDLQNYGILPAALQLERTFQGIVLITTEACPMETRSGFFVASHGASARKLRIYEGNGIGGRSHQNSLSGVIATSCSITIAQSPNNRENAVCFGWLRHTHLQEF